MIANAERSGADRRSVARLVAVQACYRMGFDDAKPETVIAEFERDGFARGAEGATALTPDRALFEALVRGTGVRRDEIDALIDSALTGGRTGERLERVLLAVLRVGVYELVARPEVPAAVIIDEYVEVARAFFGRSEPALVNAVLDRVARRVRPPSDAASGE